MRIDVEYVGLAPNLRRIIAAEQRAYPGGDTGYTRVPGMPGTRYTWDPSVPGPDLGDTGDPSVPRTRHVLGPGLTWVYTGPTDTEILKMPGSLAYPSLKAAYPRDAVPP